MKVRFTSEVNPRLKESVDEMLVLDKADMSRILVTVDSAFRTNERKLFATEGASGGNKWPPLKNKRSPKRFAGKKIMQRTGKLRRSLGTKNSDHIARSKLKPRATLTLGTNVRYAAHHIEGLLKNPALPVRDTLQQSVTQEKRYLELANEHLIRKQKRALRVLLEWRRKQRGTV